MDAKLILWLTVKNVRDDDWGEFMTVQEYNNDFLPRIERAKEFISLFESSIQHMDDKKVDKDEVKKQFKIRCWSNETKKTILDALHYYQQHEGLEKIRSSAER